MTHPTRGAAAPRPTPTRLRLLRALLLLGVPCGCAVTVDPSDALREVSRETSAATGVELPADPGTPAAQDEPLLALLDDGLDPTEAVRIGLAYNPALRAALHEVEQAVARRVQAGLLTNPSLQAAFRFPTSGGATAIEVGLFGALHDLWQRDDREAAAQAALEQRIIEVAGQAARLAADIRRTHVEALAATATLEIEREARALAARLVAQVESAVAAHAVVATDLDLARQQLVAVEVSAGEARLAAFGARRRLLTLLGLSRDASALSLTGDLASLALPTLDGERLRQTALERRFELRAAAARIERAAAEFGLQESLAWRAVGVGLAAERESGWSLGPAFTLELPLADRNQAGIAAAGARLAGLERSLTSARLAVLEELDLALEEAAIRRDLIATLDGATGAAAEAMLQRAERAYALRQTTVFPVLQLQRRLLDARRARVAQQAALGRALAEVERATATPLAGLLATMPGAASDGSDAHAPPESHSSTSPTGRNIP